MRKSRAKPNWLTEGTGSGLRLEAGTGTGLNRGETTEGALTVGFA